MVAVLPQPVRAAQVREKAGEIGDALVIDGRAGARRELQYEREVEALVEGEEPARLLDADEARDLVADRPLVARLASEQHVERTARVVAQASLWMMDEARERR